MSLSLVGEDPKKWGKITLYAKMVLQAWLNFLTTIQKRVSQEKLILSNV
jgi:hypothetical protein